ncbi:Ig-like domain-containing protein [Polyangium jinanense]|uniref:Ig-like domain-containing protein n=1 Tax=Polyangium jinanense TaxID=2829994 RepID=UPI0023404A37|nr:Ig-like domain-containing protein [Polyangium jinanense]MDC3962829.1 Ig-like domain-containing protein [Polyangium jinanense]
MRRLPLSLLLLSLLAPLGAGCELYDGPPQPRIVDAEDGVLEDATAPIVLAFSEPVDPSTLRVSIVRLETDVEGNLLDEDTDPESTPEEFFAFSTALTTGGTAELVDANATLVIKPSAPLPVGPKLALVIEAGLSDVAGNVTTVRKRLLFGYTFKLECDKPSTIFPTGKYFLLADIEKPLQTQVQLWASFYVDPETGRVRGQATNADRDKTQVCPMSCKSTEVCRLLPEPQCVAPSERAGTPDEHSDYVPYGTPPTGYSFTIEGCAVDQPGGKVVFATAPTDVVVQIPPVTLRNVTLTAEFAPDANGVLRGTGTLAADTVLIGTTASGKGEGNLLGRMVSAEEAPPGIPDPPPAP